MNYDISFTLRLSKTSRSIIKNRATFRSVSMAEYARELILLGLISEGIYPGETQDQIRELNRLRRNQEKRLRAASSERVAALLKQKGLK